MYSNFARFEVSIRHQHAAAGFESAGAVDAAAVTGFVFAANLLS